MWSQRCDDGTIYHSSMTSSDESKVVSVEGDLLLKADLLLNILTISSVYCTVLHKRQENKSREVLMILMEHQTC